MRRATIPVLSLFALLALLAWAGAASAESADARLQRGHAAFMKYCASCHGVDGKGGGPVADELRTPPSDLTSIASRRDGVFPAAMITEIIDGRRFTRGHGPSDMPVWGKKFGPDVAAGSADRVVAQDQLLLLVDYLKSLQE